MSLVNLAHVCSHLQNASKARLGLTSVPASKLHVRLMLGLQREGFLSSVTLGSTTPPAPYQLQRAAPPEAIQQMADALEQEPWLAYPLASAEQQPQAQAQAPGQSRGADQAQEQQSKVDSDRGGIAAEDSKVEAATSTPTQGATESAAASAQRPAERRPSPSPLGPEVLNTVNVPTNPAQRRLWLGLKYWNNEPVLRHMQLVSKPTRRIWVDSDELGLITRSRRAGYVQGLTRPGECMFVTTDRGVLEARECVHRRVGGMVLCRVW